MANNSRSVARVRRHTRVRKNLAGTAARPRLNVYRSLSGIYVQVIDDQAGGPSCLRPPSIVTCAKRSKA